jgi:hypothetical protein
MDRIFLLIMVLLFKTKASCSGSRACASVNTSVNPSVHPGAVFLLFSPQEFFDPRCLHDREKQVLRQFFLANPASSVAPGVEDRFA